MIDSNFQSLTHKSQTKLIFFCVVAGTLLRLFFGLSTQIWNTAHDQIAWTYAIADAKSDGLHYRHLIQYPYEGGTVPVSLFTLLVWSLQSLMPSLSLSALILDSVVRWFQLYVVSKLFAGLTARWLALWSVFAVPLLLPWGSAFFGLHGLNTVFPFLYLFISSEHTKIKHYPFVVGVLFSCMIIFSYSNVLLLAALIISTVVGWHHYSMKQWLRFLSSFSVILITHLWVRQHLNHGFNINPFAMFSLQDIVYGNTSLAENLVRFVLFWISVLPDALLMDAGWPFFRELGYWFMLALIFITAGMYVRDKKYKESTISQALLVCILFALVYSASIFFSEGNPHPSLNVYRHITYIVPLLAAAFFYLLSPYQVIGKVLSYGLIIVCSFDAILYVAHTEPYPEPSHKVAGWILSRKYGDEPKRLLRMAQNSSPEKAVELYYGYGWGITAQLLQNSGPNDTARLKQLQSTFVAFELPQRALMLEGLHFAFAEGVTPVLDKALLPILESKLDSSAYLSHK